MLGLGFEGVAQQGLSGFGISQHPGKEPAYISPAVLAPNKLLKFREP